MNVDLHSALGSLAESGDRRTAPTGDLLARVHRRRAARAVATGAVSMGTVAAVAVGAVALNGRGPATGKDPATPGPTSTYVAKGGGINCGDFGPEKPIDRASGLTWDAQLPDTWTEGEPLVVSAQVDPTDDVAPLTTATIQVSLLSAGRVVAVAGSWVEVGADGMAPFAAPFTAATVVEPCGAGRLPPGEYVALTSLFYDFEDARSGILQVSEPITVVGWPSDSSVETERAAALADLLATAPDAAAPLGTCGSTLRPDEWAAAPTDGLGVDVTVTSRPEFPRPQSLLVDALLTNTGSEALIVAVGADGARTVLTRDGVVVAIGESLRPMGDLEPAPMAPDEGWGVRPGDTFRLCASPGDGIAATDLPAGDYQLVQLVRADVTTADDAGGASHQVTVVSRPVDVTLR